MAENLSYKTAIKRNKLSGPMRWLVDNDYVTKDMLILDYGCGRGDDVRLLSEQGFAVLGYDPHWNPLNLTTLRPDVITCHFVLNTLETDKEIEETWKKMLALLPRKWYISVRADVKNLNGPTKKGTYQRYVDIRRFDPWVVMLKKTSSYILWQI